MRPVTAESELERTSSRYDDLNWAERSAYWLNSGVEKPHRRRSRQPTPKPLVLTGHGVRLRVDNGALLVRNGFTHYPQAVDERRYFPGDRRLPSRIIVVDGSGSLSFDVLDWLSAQNVPLIRVGWRGDVQAVVGGIGYSADPIKVAAQIEARRKDKTLPIASRLIRQKLENSIATLRALPDTPARDASSKASVPIELVGT